MIGAVMMLVGIILIITGFTGRWRAVLHAVAPQFAHAASDNGAVSHETVGVGTYG